jgi:hypothetical protein
MGNLLRRSSAVRPEGTKSKWRKGNQKRSQTLEIPTERDKVLIENENEKKNSNHEYENWDQRMNQQQISNINGSILIIF